VLLVMGEPPCPHVPVFLERWGASGVGAIHLRLGGKVTNVSW
jgi:hypothetical protein